MQLQEKVNTKTIGQEAKSSTQKPPEREDLGHRMLMGGLTQDFFNYNYKCTLHLPSQGNASRAGLTELERPWI